MKILLVDDDFNTVEAIREAFDWQSLGFEEVLQAYNYTNARKIVESDDPEVILCDIEMPGGSGIDLLKWLRDNGYTSQFVFLTCHESFVFASAAIEYGALGYLTKPFSKEKLREAIEKARSQSLRVHRLQKAEKKMETFRDKAAESFWRSVMFYRIAPTPEAVRREAEALDAGMDPEAQYRLVLISVLKSHVSEWKPDMIQLALRNLSEEILSCKCTPTALVGYDTTGNYYILAIFSGREDGGQVFADCKRLSDTAQTFLNCESSCYISDVAQIWELAELRQRMEKRDYFAPAVGSVSFYTEDQTGGEASGVSLDYGSYIALLEEGNQIMVVKQIQKELNTVLSSGRSAADGFSRIYHDYTQIIYLVLNNHEIQAHTLFTEPHSRELADNAVRSVFDMMKWVYYITERTILLLSQLRQSGSLITKAKEYIAEHYAEEIGRTEIAASLYVTPDYLSRLFKTELGTSVNDYLTQYRIEQAKILLRRGKDSITDIAAKVGFNNTAYFSTVYKKIVGCTPNETRKGTMK